MEDYTKEEDNENRMKILKRHTSQLREHFDNVQILVSKYDPEGNDGLRETSYSQHGSGNWFARYGHAKKFVIQEEEDFKNPANEQSGYE